MSAQNLGRTTDEHRLDADTGYIMINHKGLKLQAIQHYDAYAVNEKPDLMVQMWQMILIEWDLDFVYWKQNIYFVYIF